MQKKRNAKIYASREFFGLPSACCKTLKWFSSHLHFNKSSSIQLLKRDDKFFYQLQVTSLYFAKFHFIMREILMIHQKLFRDHEFMEQFILLNQTLSKKIFLLIFIIIKYKIFIFISIQNFFKSRFRRNSWLHNS